MNGKEVAIFAIEELLGELAHNRYLVPLYQREYAWGRTEICQLLDDLWESFVNNSQRNYHLGTLVVCRRFHEGDERTYELIDGQQRLTTLSLLYRIIHHDKERIRRKVFFDNRPIAENFLDAFFSSADMDLHDPATFRDAIDIIAGYQYSDFKSSEAGKLSKRHERWGQIDSILGQIKKVDGAPYSFKQFILRKVKLFRVEMPSTTDVAAYFEVMNNRGKQLEFHELVKARLIAKLREPAIRSRHNVAESDIGEKERCFNVFWMQCSEMNGHLAQRLHETLKMETDSHESWISISAKLADYDRCRAEEPQSIIDDFPNFLMHVLRVYCKSNEIPFDEMTIPLDDRVLDNVFRHYEKYVDPYDFLDCLIRVRLWFDRHIVKAMYEDKAVSEWRLEGVVRYCGHYDLRNTFSGEEPFVKNSREKLIKLESMLQVTYRTRRYKSWLSEVLLKFMGEQISADALIDYLEQKVLLPRLQKVMAPTNEGESTTIYNKGTDTPHLILNVIDYLLWCEDMNQMVNYGRAKLKDFVFAYRSSIEHHHAQQIFQGEEENDGWNPNDYNDIGNLCLVYPSENSSLSNHSPKEKVLRFGKKKAPPKQQIMYSETLSGEDGEGVWSKKLMRRHSKYVQRLLSDFIGSSQNAECQNI